MRATLFIALKAGSRRPEGAGGQTQVPVAKARAYTTFPPYLLFSNVGYLGIYSKTRLHVNNTTRTSVNKKAVSREPTCRLPNGNLLGSRQVCSSTPDIRTAPQRQFAGEPTGLLLNARYPNCRCPNADMLGSRHVWAPTPMFDWL